MSTEQTAQVIEAYLGEEGLDRVAEDAVYTVMGTGQQARGRQAIGELLRIFYEEAFQATATSITQVIGESAAAFEYEFRGKHTGEFAGIPPTGRHVAVPLCVVYEVDGEYITSAHIYFEMDALQRQLED